jgi:hypothetical protein
LDGFAQIIGDFINAIDPERTIPSTRRRALKIDILCEFHPSGIEWVDRILRRGDQQSCIQ